MGKLAVFGRKPRAFWLPITAILLGLASFFFFPRRQDAHQKIELVDGDESWPIRDQYLPYDISLDYPYPRKLEYDVDEGTWLHLTVHPLTGDIVFAMLGDLYCLDAREYESHAKSRARPILLGVPYDTDPSFDATGTRLAFRSDAVSGVDNVWIINWYGCQNVDVRPPSASVSRPALVNALKHQDSDELLVTLGVAETLERTERRLLRDGRLEGNCATPELSHAPLT